MTQVHLFLVSLAYICIHAQIFNDGDYVNDYSMIYMADKEDTATAASFPKPEIIRLQQGADMVLKCNTTACHYHKHKLTWQFKACQSEFNAIPCAHIYESFNSEQIRKNLTWDSVTAHVFRRKCLSSLELVNVNENHNGLYRCMSGNKIIKTFEVEIIDSLNKYVGRPPELLDLIPSNITIFQDIQLIIQCKVYSKQLPIIWWFKQSDENNYDIHYSDRFYKRINTSVQVYAIPNELNVYLSKLNIYKASEADSGVYVCLAMTESGKDYKEAFVNVITNGSYLEPHMPLFLLFLIPVLFALIPISVWLCYYKQRKKDVNQSKILMANEQKLTRPIISHRITSHETILV